MKACKKCHMLADSDVCPYCNAPMSEHWQGYMVIIDPGRSRIAEKMGIKMPGKYALKVR
ncbi:MAG: transcription elongation factor subunit Spt4 [Thermoplasmatota archaeon]